MILRNGIKSYPLKNCINLFIVGMFLLPLYIDFFGTMSMVYGLSTLPTTFVYYACLWALLLLSIPTITKALDQRIVIGALIFVGGVLVHYLIFPNSAEYLFGTAARELFTFSPRSLVAVVPYILIGLTVTNWQNLYNALRKAARCGIILGVLSYLLTIRAGEAIAYDDMSQAYALCLMTCVLISSYKRWDWLYITFGVLAMFLAGTRGAIVGVLVAVLIRVVVLQTNKRKKQIGIFGCIIAIVLVYIGLPILIVDLISDLFAAIGINNLRIIDYAKEGMLMDTSGRDEITRLLVDKIKENPILGYGLGADRGFSQTEHYAHNLIVEMWVAFGVVLGSAIVAWMAYWLYKGLSHKNRYACMIVGALISSIVVKLMFSSSFLYAKELFILLGFCMTDIKNPKSLCKQHTISAYKRKI